MSGSPLPGPPPSGPTAATCLLRIGDRVVLRAASPPEAEYALFDIGDIELRTSEPGRVREHGYETTVAAARERLDDLGITAELAAECAGCMQPVIAEAYARGTAVRRVARYLGTLELLQSEAFDGQSYRGVFLDVATLARDLQTRGAAATLQALYLAALLAGETDDTRVALATDVWTKPRKPGERTHRRPTLASGRTLLSALAGLARAGPRPDVREQLARQDVIAFLRARADAAPDEQARQLYQDLEKQVAVRDMPERGPLADRDLWTIETRLDAGDLNGVMELVERVERTHGRTPGTTYLRARAALALRAEPPRLIAERVSALALSMTSFQELSLLAAEAWLEAGDSRRAMPFARDLVDSPSTEEGLLLRAQRLLARAVGAAPDTSPSKPPSFPAPPPPPRLSPRPELALRSSRPPPPARVPELDLDPPPLPYAETEAPEGGASFTLEMPPTPRAPHVTPAPRPTSSMPPRKPTTGRERRRISGVIVETRPPRSYDPRAEPDDADDMIVPSSRDPRNRTSAPPDDVMLHGASLPIYGVENPPPRLPSLPPSPRSSVRDEIAEKLSLPAGAVGEPQLTKTLPRTPLEARIRFTLLSRELGLDYRLQHGIELHTDVTSIQRMQQVLLDTYPERVIRTRDEAEDVERHGAFLSEILARLLDAQWFDISASQVGYWAMIVPPDTRVWPFGRVARLIAMGTDERDLVSYFFELKSRRRR